MKTKKGPILSDRTPSKLASNFRQLHLKKLVSHDGFEPSTLTLKVGAEASDLTAENSSLKPQSEDQSELRIESKLSKNSSLIPSVAETPCYPNATQKQVATVGEESQEISSNGRSEMDPP